MTTFPLNATHITTAEFIVQESVVGPDDGGEEEDEDNEFALLAVPEER